MKEKRQKQISFRTLLLCFFLISILVISMAVVYIFQTSRLSFKNMSDLMNQSQKFSTINENLNQLHSNMNTYLFSRDSKALQSYYQSINLLRQDIEDLQDKAEYTADGIKYTNLYNMSDHYIATVEDAIIAKRNERVKDYILGYQNATKEYNYINDYILNIQTNDLKNSSIQYQEMAKEMQNHTLISYIMFFITLVVLVILIIVFSFETTRPISQLAGYASQMTKGDYNIKVFGEPANKEVAILFKTFEKMVDSTKDHVSNLEKRRQLEKELSSEQIKNLEYENALQTAEFHALYSQVNPHFIFNTINIGAKLALMQDDNIVSDYLENAGDLFRYNLSGLHEANLSEEVDNVTAYMQLLITRFGSRVAFNKNIDTNLKLRDFILPRMTLQPLVENAFIHGIDPLEEGGIITLTIKSLNYEKVEIIIEDTGGRFPLEHIDQFKNMDINNKFIPRPISAKGQVSGIGLSNIVWRLCLFFQEKNLLEIKSQKGSTKIILSLPKKRDKEVIILED